MTNDKGLDVKLGCAPKLFGQTIRQRQVTLELCATNESKSISLHQIHLPKNQIYDLNLKGKLGTIFKSEYVTCHHNQGISRHRDLRRGVLVDSFYKTGNHTYQGAREHPTGLLSFTQTS